jgi:hypothetical protein
MIKVWVFARNMERHSRNEPDFGVPLPVCPYLCKAMTQEQIKVMRDRIVVLRRFL